LIVCVLFLFYYDIFSNLIYTYWDIIDYTDLKIIEVTLIVCAYRLLHMDFDL